MQKHKKRNWKRPVAGLLAVLLAAGTIDISQFASLTSYAYSKDYGICTDNHLYSDAGANCKADQYVCFTVSTCIAVQMQVLTVKQTSTCA